MSNEKQSFGRRFVEQMVISAIAFPLLLLWSNAVGYDVWDLIKIILMATACEAVGAFIYAFAWALGTTEQ